LLLSTQVDIDFSSVGQNPVFVSCVILIVYMMGTKRAGLPIHKNKDLAHVATAMEILKVAESRLMRSFLRYVPPEKI
jgi:hypothetical protein